MKLQQALQKSPVTNFFKSIAVFLPIVALLLSFVSCSPSKASYVDSEKMKIYEQEIVALKALISSLDIEIDELKSNLDSESKRIEAILTNIENELDALNVPTLSEPSNEYFGFKYKEENDEISIISYSGSSLDLIIPASIKGKPVTSICDNAFDGSNIRSVSIPDTVRAIGWFAFRNCTSLSKAIISKNVELIGYEAFSGCGALVIYTSLNSYVYRYAESYGISVATE